MLPLALFFATPELGGCALEHGCEKQVNLYLFTTDTTANGANTSGGLGRGLKQRTPDSSSH